MTSTATRQAAKAAALLSPREFRERISPDDPGRTARRLAAAGIPVFPVRPDKRPATTHGFKDATTDPGTVDAWFRDRTLGVAYTPTAAGLVHIDLDPDKASGSLDVAIASTVGLLGSDMIRPGPNRYPYRYRTPSGGMHLVMTYTEPVPGREPRVRPMVDQLGSDGYAILALPDGSYDWSDWQGGDVAFGNYWSLVSPKAALGSVEGPQRTVSAKRLRNATKGCGASAAWTAVDALPKGRILLPWAEAECIRPFRNLVHGERHERALKVGILAAVKNIAAGRLLDPPATLRRMRSLWVQGHDDLFAGQEFDSLLGWFVANRPGVFGTAEVPS